MLVLRILGVMMCALLAACNSGVGGATSENAQEPYYSFFVEDGKSLYALHRNDPSAQPAKVAAATAAEGFQGQYWVFRHADGNVAKNAYYADVVYLNEGRFWRLNGRSDSLPAPVQLSSLIINEGCAPIPPYSIDPRQSPFSRHESMLVFHLDEATGCITPRYGDQASPNAVAIRLDMDAKTAPEPFNDKLIAIHAADLSNPTPTGYLGIDADPDVPGSFLLRRYNAQQQAPVVLATPGKWMSAYPTVARTERSIIFNTSSMYGPYSSPMLLVYDLATGTVSGSSSYCQPWNMVFGNTVFCYQGFEAGFGEITRQFLDGSQPRQLIISNLTSSIFGYYDGYFYYFGGHNTDPDTGIMHNVESGLHRVSTDPALYPAPDEFLRSDIDGARRYNGLLVAYSLREQGNFKLISLRDFSLQQDRGAELGCRVEYAPTYTYSGVDSWESRGEVCTHLLWASAPGGAVYHNGPTDFAFPDVPFGMKVIDTNTAKVSASLGMAPADTQNLRFRDSSLFADVLGVLTQLGNRQGVVLLDTRAPGGLRILRSGTAFELLF